MLFQGNAAYELAYQDVLEAPVREPLSVHQGGGLDARTDNEAMSSLAKLIKVGIVITVLFAVLGGVRVALTAETVTLLEQVRTARDTVAAATDTRTELQIERSALLSSDRIQRIATESYGMVYASDVDTISIDADGEQGASSSQADTQAAPTTDSAGPAGSQPVAKIRS